MNTQTLPGLPGHAAGTAEPPAEPKRSTFRKPHLHVDSFLKEELAREMRDAIDRHFALPYKQNSTHQVWNYWFVPGMYTFLRTQPDKVIPTRLVERFHAALSQWAWNVLGMGYVTQPYLSLYIDGCEQRLHNDATNGRFGYVYSLTNDVRDTRGGETIVMREADPFRSNLTNMTGGIGGMYETIESRFNRLGLFDDRMPHGVQRLEGSMDPYHGRLVLHGHISESGPTARGALAADVVRPIVEEIANRVLDGEGGAADRLHGPISVRVRIGADGRAHDVHLMLDRVVGPLPGMGEGVGDRIAEALRDAVFPTAAGETEAIVPLAIGGLLPWMMKAPG